MPRDELIIEEDGEGTVVLRQAGRDHLASGRARLSLPAGFSVEDLAAAALASPWVVEQGGQMLVEDTIGCDLLAKTLEAMLQYFRRPGDPREELLRVKSEADRYHALQEADPATIPLWAYAWLDLAVRNDLAEAARDLADIWSEDRAALDLERHRHARVLQVASRYCESGATAAPASSKMTPSQRVRRPEKNAQRGAG